MRPNSSARPTPAATWLAIALEQPQVVLVEVGPARVAARPQLPPGDVAEHDRHGQARAPPEPLEQGPLGLVQVGVVDDADVGAALEQQPLERVVAGQPVDLVARVGLLARRELAGVDDGAQDLGLRLPARHRDRRGVERGARLLRREVEQLGQRVRRRHRRGQRHQHPQLAAEVLERVAGAGAVTRQRARGAGASGAAGASRQSSSARHDPRVELGAGAALELLARRGDRERRAVGAVGDERVPGVAGQHDPRGERDVLAREAVGIAAAVPALVRVAHGGGDGVEAGQRAQDALADRRGARASAPTRHGRGGRACAARGRARRSCRCRAAAPPTGRRRSRRGRGRAGPPPRPPAARRRRSARRCSRRAPRARARASAPSRDRSRRPARSRPGRPRAPRSASARRPAGRARQPRPRGAGPPDGVNPSSSDCHRRARRRPRPGPTRTSRRPRPLRPPGRR